MISRRYLRCQPSNIGVPGKDWGAGLSAVPTWLLSADPDGCLELGLGEGPSQGVLMCGVWPVPGSPENDPPMTENSPARAGTRRVAMRMAAPGLDSRARLTAIPEHGWWINHRHQRLLIAAAFSRPGDAAASPIVTKPPMLWP